MNAVITFILVLSAAMIDAIKYDERDGENHPFVGLMVAWDENDEKLWRCSGALLSPNVFLTAGHCVGPPAVRATIWFDSDVESGLLWNGYPNLGKVSGRTVPYPGYDPKAFVLNDLGLVILDEQVEGITEFAQLPKAGLLDSLTKGMPKSKIKFTAVGYGPQLINPVFVEDGLVRCYSEPSLIQINVPGFVGDFSLLLTNNHATGGACFGDSGGPNFLNIAGCPEYTHVVAGVTSFGKKRNCTGTGGVFRLDKQPELDWIAEILAHESEERQESRRKTVASQLTQKFKLRNIMKQETE